MAPPEFGREAPASLRHPVTPRHPEVYTAAEAAAYLGLDSERSLETLRDKWGLRSLPIGRGLYHRQDLDALVTKAATGQAPSTGTREAAGSRTKLRLGG